MPVNGAQSSFSGPTSSGASLIRFRSPQLALLFGADFSLLHSKNESDGTPGFTPFTGTFASIAARLGMRSYRQSSTERLRPVVGLGLRGGYSTGPNDARSWSTGIYGELGAVYFVASHLSLGETGELEANYTKQRQDSGAGGTNVMTATSINGSLARVGAPCCVAGARVADSFPRLLEFHDPALPKRV